jgi:hypothetical protein
MPGLSAAARIQDLEGLAEEFNQDLLNTPGNVLTGNFRCAVAQCARDALRDCGGCQTLSRDTCMGDEQVYRKLAKLSHEPELAVEDSQKAILNLVHALVNHQTKLSDDWYLSTCVALQDAHLIPAYIEDEHSRQFMIWSLFCEICLLTVISHGIHMAFLVLDKDPPALPHTSNTVPLFVDFNKIKRSERKVHQSDGISFAPYLRPTDVDINSPELEKLSPEAFKSFQHNMNIHSQKIAMIFAPQDLAFLDFMMDVYYMTNSDINKPYKKLDPITRCADHVTRHDLEVVGMAVAASYDCNY